MSYRDALLSSLTDRNRDGRLYNGTVAPGTVRNRRAANRRARAARRVNR